MSSKSSSCCGYIAIFRILKMAVAAILEILLDIGAEIHQHAKFRPNRSIGYGDIKIFRFFKMAAAAILVVEFTKFHWLTVARWPRRITSPIFVNIGRSISEMLQFFVFSRRPPPPSWIVEFTKNLLAVGVWRVHMHHYTKFRQNRSLPTGLYILLALTSFFSPLGKLAERAIYFTFRNFFFFFTRSKAISVSTGPIFTIFSPNGRYLREFS